MKKCIWGGLNLFSCVVFIFFLSAVLTNIRASYASVSPQVSAGEYHSLALKGEGTVWAWGSNSNGQLGDGVPTGATSGSPVSLSALSDVTIIASGYNHSLALKSDGTVWACGSNSYGQLGDGSTTDSNTPVQVSDLTDIIAIAGGENYSLALKSDGTVWAWGSNGYGQLGDGSYTNKSTPGQILNFGGITAIACGGTHSLALKSDGTVWVWGHNDYGQLGDGTTTDSNSPEQVSSLSDVSAVAGGAYHSMALKSDGTVWAWGDNWYGELGNGTNTNSQTPVQVSSLSDVSAIDSGKNHNIALKSDGTVWAWGLNWYGQLGNGSTTDSNTPVQVRSINDVTAITGGMYHNLAVKSDGKVWAWGDNAYSELGEGTFSAWYRTTPVQVKNLNLNYVPTPSPTPSPTPTPTPTSSTGDIEGVVISAVTTDPISGARVVLDGTVFSIRTGTDGTYVLPMVEAGDYTLTASADGFVSESKSVTVTASAITVADFILQPAATPTPTPVQKSSIFGTVNDSDNNALQGVAVAITGTGISNSTSTDDGGLYQFGELDAGNYTLSYTKDGYQSHTQDISLASGEVKDAGTITMELTGGNIYGYVTDFRGNPIASVVLSLKGVKSKVAKTASSDEFGAFGFADLDADTYVIYAKKRGYKKARQKVVIEEGESEELEILMKKINKRLK